MFASLVVPACGGEAVFHCADDTACVLEGIAGTCEANGYCAFPDNSCPSGRRYGELAPTAFAMACAGEDPPTGSSSTTFDPPDTPWTTSTSTTSANTSTGTRIDPGETGSTSAGERVDMGSPPADAANYVFVSSSTLLPSADMQSDADALCNELAGDAGLAGTYAAWVSAVGADAKDRLHANGVLAQGWVRTDGLPFANRVADIVTGAIWYPINLDETGAFVGSVPVLTATNGSGEVSSRCMDWKNFTDTGEYKVGWTDGTFERWTNQGKQRCDEAARVYCFGIDRVFDVSPETSFGRTAFLSDTTVAGDAGLEAFDAACQASADGAGLSGTFLAAVATSSASALSRFDGSTAPWLNGRGIPINDADVPLANALRLNTTVGFRADGSAIDALFWTGADAAATSATDHSCGNWSSVDEATQGWVSRSAQSEDWFGTDTVPCNSPQHVLCMEQTDAR